MNDRLKFRVNLKGEKIVRDVVSFDFQNLRLAVDIAGIKEWKPFSKVKKIMQSTGLTDKNGKLIYEGDLVKVFNKMTDDYFKKNGLVKWHKGYWEIYGVGLIGFIEGMNAYTVEVIGNPELLKEQKNDHR